MGSHFKSFIQDFTYISTQNVKLINKDENQGLQRSKKSGQNNSNNRYLRSSLNKKK